MKDNQYNYCNFFLKKQQIIYSAESKEPKRSAKDQSSPSWEEQRMLSALLAFSAKLTENRNKFQASAIIINSSFLKESAFLHIISICTPKGKAHVHTAQNRFSAQ